MAHEIESMFSVKETPWHGLGVIIKDAPSIEHVLNLSGLNWPVKMQNLYLSDGQLVDQKAIVRLNIDGSVSNVLGYATERYTPLQNADLVEFFRPFVDANLINFETGGCLKSGQKVWILATINEPEMSIVGGDVVRKYLLLSNAHNGKNGIHVGFTPIRTVCANTLALAHNSIDSKLIRVFHSKQCKENLELLRDTINLANQTFEATAEQYRLLTKKAVHQGDIAKLVDVVFYNSKQAESDREQIARDNLTSRITELFESGYGNNTQGVSGTQWALYNGVTQYLSYERGREQDTRLDNLWFGTAKTLNEKAFEYLVAA